MYYLLIIIQRICDQMQKINNLKKNSISKFSLFLCNSKKQCSMFLLR